MPLYRVQLAVERGADLAIDNAVNTFYLQDIGPTTDPGNLAQDAANLWANSGSWPAQTTGVRAKIYDMADPEPRVPLATRWAETLSVAQEGGPREVALCLSFYATNNVPRRRGRLYIGPFDKTLCANERPTTALMNRLGTMAGGLANLGGVDVDWMQYSPTLNLANKVTNWWVDNEWDTVRSRGLRGTTRNSGTTGE